MPNYYRIILGKKSAHASQCFASNFIGCDFGLQQDLAGHLPDEMRPFNTEFIPVYLSTHPDKSRIAAGLACGALWTIAKGIAHDDIVLCPDGTGSYRVGRVRGDYHYDAGGLLPHRRHVHWLDQSIARFAMSEALQRSTGSIGTVSEISDYAAELQALLAPGVATPAAAIAHAEIQQAATFMLEKHLEDFLIKNWANTELGKTFDIYTENGEIIVQQYRTDTGRMDLLCISKDKKTLLVVELKKARASDEAVGQVLRYMGFVKTRATADQEVRGVIIAQEDDARIRSALAMVPAVSFYRYEISFRLFSG